MAQTDGAAPESRSEGRHGRRLRLHLGPKASALYLVAASLLTAWLTISTVSWVGSYNLLSDKADHVRSVEEAYAELASRSRASSAALTAQVEELEHTTEQQRQAIAELIRIQGALRRQLDSRERQLGAVIRQRDEARSRALHLADQETAMVHEINELYEDRAILNEHLQTLQVRLAEVSEQRESGRRIENGLRWQVSQLESRLRDVEEYRQTAQIWFEDYVANSVEALEHLFHGTGVDVETLLARAAGDDVGEASTDFQGGPLQGLDAESREVSVAPVRLGAGNMVSDEIRRLSALQKLASALPLASPLDHFHVTGYYGKRRDPLTRNLAFHGGIDLGAAAGSQALATAPGRVIFAGDGGPYGNLVEIDHGMGVTTRYAHLKEIAVEAGADVEFRHPVGVIGSTGRSTGRHLHYEIRIDGEPYDPANFLEAGRYLVDIFNLKALSGGQSTTPQG